MLNANVKCCCYALCYVCIQHVEQRAAGRRDDKAVGKSGIADGKGKADLCW